MASVTTFIRNMPASSLQAYFHHTGIELPTEVDWEAPEPEVVRVTLRAVDEMDDEARARIEAERQARRAAREEDDDDDFDDDDYDVEVVYAPE